MKYSLRRTVGTWAGFVTEHVAPDVGGDVVGDI